MAKLQVYNLNDNTIRVEVACENRDQLNLMFNLYKDSLLSILSQQVSDGIFNPLVDTIKIKVTAGNAV